METEVHGTSQEQTDGDRVLPGTAARKRAAVELIRSHGSALRSTARRYSICADDADDAYQRGLEILLDKAPTTDPRQLVPWSRTVIKHEALAIRKARERILGRPAIGAVLEEEQDWVQLIPSEGDGPEERVAGREKIARSREALARLKPNELKALTQLAEGYSYAEIAAMNNWTRTKVNRCLAEGRQRFRSVFRQSEAGERCAEFEPLLSASCDGELDQARLRQVEDHLAACGSCRATLRTYRAAPKAAAALAPVLPVSRGLWERMQEMAISIHGKITAIADPSGAGAGAGAAGATRGALPAVVAKVAAVCAGTAGTAAICVATGVLPAPVIHPQVERQPEHPARHVTAEVRPDPPVYEGPAVDAGTPSAGVDRPDGEARSRPNRGSQEAAGPPPAPPPSPTETEFTPEAAGTPVQAPAPPPAPAVSSGGGGGGSVPVGGGGEFGP